VYAGNSNVPAYMIKGGAQQASTGAAESLIGSGFTWAGYKLATSKVQLRQVRLLGGGMTITGGLLIDDRIQNIPRGLLRGAAELEFQARLYFTPETYANSDEIFSQSINSCGRY
jgi:hypothetical protein